MKLDSYKIYDRQNKTIRINPLDNFNFSTKQLKQKYCTYCFRHCCGDNMIHNNKALKKQKGIYKYTKYLINLAYNDTTIC